MPIIVMQDGALIFNRCKYDGKTVESIADTDPGFLQFVRNGRPAESLSDEIFEALEELMERHKIPLERRRRSSHRRKSGGHSS